MPLGLFSDTVFRSSENIYLEPGDLLAFLTDGVTEATSPEENEFGADRVLEILKENRGCRARKIVDMINKAALIFSGENPPHDDMTTPASAR